MMEELGNSGLNKSVATLKKEAVIIWNKCILKTKFEKKNISQYIQLQNQAVLVQKQMSYQRIMTRKKIDKNLGKQNS